MEQKPFTVTNPLTKHFRTPAIYLKLPSQGSYWPTPSITIPANGEIPVLPMTTKDEIIIKTPDALLNGQGVISTIQSCCPSITNAWDMPSIDVDAIIIAIRIASYGNSMEFTSTCPHCKEESDYAMDLSIILESIKAPNYEQTIPYNDLTIKLKPQSYLSLNHARMINFEEQQILRTLEEMDDDNRLENQARFDTHLQNIVELQLDSLSNSTDYILTNDGVKVTDTTFIKEFYQNCDNNIIKEIKKLLEQFVNESKIKPLPVNCHHCEKQFEVSIEFDWSSFFANGS